MSGRCKSCDQKMWPKDFIVDEELCRCCLSDIRSDLNPKRYTKTKLELIDEVKPEEKKDENL